jgi:hypothetical protein
LYKRGRRRQHGLSKATTLQLATAVEVFILETEEVMRAAPNSTCILILAAVAVAAANVHPTLALYPRYNVMAAAAAGPIPKTIDIDDGRRPMQEEQEFQEVEHL